MIGVSLRYNWLLEKGRSSEGDDFLLQLKKRGVGSVELRSVPIGEQPANVLYAANLLWDYGFKITVHANTKTLENIVEEVISPLEDLVRHLRQKEIIVTVHPIVGDNTAMVCKLSDYIHNKQLPLRIALENERRMPDKTNGDSLSMVLKAVTDANRDNVGICFDMGHLAWYYRTQTNSPYQIPPKEFLDRVIHTHIHDCVENTTHFFLKDWSEPVASFVKALDFGYFGVYNLEISPEKFGQYTMQEGYYLSVDTLRKNFPFHATVYEDVKLNYDNRFRKAIEIFDEKSGCFGSPVSASAYLFNTNGFCWAMDVSFRNAWLLAESPLKIKDYFKKLSLMLLTHYHEDHVERKTICALADTEITWLVPSFLTDIVIECGVSRDKIIEVNAGDTVDFGPLTIKVLRGRHFRPNGKGIEAVGYMITADKAPSLCFPGDIRDFSLQEAEPLNADYCFAHVWLTDFPKEPEKYIPKSEEFAEFMLQKSTRNILLTHLYENARLEEQMWQTRHAQVISEEIKKRSPQTIAYAPKCGEILRFDK